jgi:hypothetical protein
MRTKHSERGELKLRGLGETSKNQNIRLHFQRLIAAYNACSKS